MAETYSADIHIGGKVKRERIDELFDAIDADGAFDTLTDNLFDRDKYELPADGILRLYDTEASWGHFDDIEAACRDLGLRFVRWSEDGDKAVFDGETLHQIAGTPDGATVLTRAELAKFETLEAAIAWLDLMDGDPPALEIED